MGILFHILVVNEKKKMSPKLKISHIYIKLKETNEKDQWCIILKRQGPIVLVLNVRVQMFNLDKR